MATLNLGRIKPVFRGAYSGSTAYVVDDIVTSGGSSYICIQAHGAGTQAVNQTAYWTQMAAGGTDVGTTITTQGDILYRDGSGLQRLAAGTSGQFLKTQGSGANPVWADNAAVEFKVATNNTTTTATYTGTQSSWTDHITQAITTTITAPVICNADFQHSYESGAVNMAARFILTPASGSDIEGAAQQIACYGFGNNRAMGAHNMHTSFQDVAAGSYTVKLQARNDGDSSTTGYLNYFRGGSGTQGDRIYILYK